MKNPPTLRLPELSASCERRKYEPESWSRLVVGPLGCCTAGGTFGDNLRLYVFRGNSLIAKSDGIIATSQGVSIPNAPMAAFASTWIIPSAPWS